MMAQPSAIQPCAMHSLCRSSQPPHLEHEEQRESHDSCNSHRPPPAEAAAAVQPPSPPSPAQSEEEAHYQVDLKSPSCLSPAPSQQAQSPLGTLRDKEHVNCPPFVSGLQDGHGHVKPPLGGPGHASAGTVASASELAATLLANRQASTAPPYTPAAAIRQAPAPEQTCFASSPDPEPPVHESPSARGDAAVICQAMGKQQAHGVPGIAVTPESMVIQGAAGPALGQPTFQPPHPQQPHQLQINQKQVLFRTEWCRSFTETGYCRYGDKCRFAHAASQLNPVDRHPKYKTEKCKNFHTLGYCSYGQRCCYIHAESQFTEAVHKVVHDEEGFFGRLDGTPSKSQLSPNPFYPTYYPRQSPRHDSEDTAYDQTVDRKSLIEEAIDRVKMRYASARCEKLDLRWWQSECDPYYEDLLSVTPNNPNGLGTDEQERFMFGSGSLLSENAVVTVMTSCYNESLGKERELRMMEQVKREEEQRMAAKREMAWRRLEWMGLLQPADGMPSDYAPHGMVDRGHVLQSGPHGIPFVARGNSAATGAFPPGALYPSDSFMFNGPLTNLLSAFATMPPPEEYFDGISFSDDSTTCDSPSAPVGDETLIESCEVEQTKGKQAFQRVDSGLGSDDNKEGSGEVVCDGDEEDIDSRDGAEEQAESDEDAEGYAVENGSSIFDGVDIDGYLDVRPQAMPPFHHQTTIFTGPQHIARRPHQPHYRLPRDDGELMTKEERIAMILRDRALVFQGPKRLDVFRAITGDL